MVYTCTRPRHWLLELAVQNLKCPSVGELLGREVASFLVAIFKVMGWGCFFIFFLFLFFNFFVGCFLMDLDSGLFWTDCMF